MISNNLNTQRTSALPAIQTRDQPSAGRFERISEALASQDDSALMRELRAALNDGDAASVQSVVRARFTKLDFSEPNLRTVDEFKLILTGKGLATLVSLLQQGAIKLDKLALGYVETLGPFTDALENLPGDSLKALHLEHTFIVPPGSPIAHTLQPRHTDKIAAFLWNLPQGSKFRELLVGPNVLANSAQHEALQAAGQHLANRGVKVTLGAPFLPPVQQVNGPEKQKAACTHLLKLLNGGKASAFKAALNDPAYRVTELNLNLEGAGLTKEGALALAEALRDHSLPLQQVVLGRADDLTPLLSELPNFNLFELDMTKVSVPMVSEHVHWNQGLTRAHLRELNGISLSRRGDFSMKTVIRMDSSDISTSKDAIAIHTLQDIKTAGVVPMIDIFRPKSAVAVLYDRLNRGVVLPEMRDFDFSFDLVGDNADDAQLRLTEKGLQTLVKRLEEDFTSRVKLGCVETLEPWMKLNGEGLPALTDLSHCKIFSMVNGVPTLRPLSDQHADALRKQVWDAKRGAGGIFQLQTLRIDASGMSPTAVESLKFVCDYQPTMAPNVALTLEVVRS